MKRLLGALALSTALTAVPLLAEARPVTITTQMSAYGGGGAFVAFYLTDPQGKYAGTLWMAGQQSKYYKDLRGWRAASGGDLAQLDGITGASVGAGKTLKITVDVKDALLDAGYVLHVDAGAEDMRPSPNEITTPLSKAGSGKPVKGRSYIDTMTVSF